MNSGQARLFVSVEPDGAVREALVRVQHALKREIGRSVRIGWVASENIHLTLAFLGDTPVDKIPQIGAALDACAAHFDAFVCRLASPGFYGSERHPRVVWAGLDAPRTLFRLQAELAERLAELGFEPEKRAFSAHLTLGRVRQCRSPVLLLEALSGLRGKVRGELHVSELRLMRSDLKPDGVEYHCLHTAALR